MTDISNADKLENQNIAFLACPRLIATIIDTFGKTEMSHKFKQVWVKGITVLLLLCTPFTIYHSLTSFS